MTLGSLPVRHPDEDCDVSSQMPEFDRASSTPVSTHPTHGDLGALGESVVAYSETPLGKALTRTLAASDDTEETAAARTLFWRQRHEECHVII